MKKIKNFLSKYKFFLIINLVIFISYIFIASKVDLFGIDDVLANSHIYNPEFNFFDSIAHIYKRVATWNARIGELLYFIVGCFPRFVYFILNGFVLLIFFNFIYIYTFGTKSKELFNKKQYFISILSNYIICITLFPAFSEVIIWMAGAFNHLWDTVIVLIAGLPFRLLLDEYDIFLKHKKLKYFYFIFCIFAGFSVENVVPWLLAYMLIILFVKLFKKTSKKWMYISIFIVLISFLTMCILNSTHTRIDFFINTNWAEKSKQYLFLKFIWNYRYIILLLIFLTIIFLIKVHNENNKLSFKNLKFIIIQLLISFISLLVIYFSPYFALRTTTLIFFFLLTLNTYLIHYIFNKRNVMVATIFIDIFIIIIMSFRLNLFYDDFNKFNNDIRYVNMKTQVEQGLKNINCPQYENRYNYFYSKRLVSYEDLYCDESYLRYLFNDDTLSINE